jgi:hypothetical protein
MVGSVSTTTPSFLHRLLDDAAIFPPGEAPLTAAISAHGQHRSGALEDFIGPFVVDAARLAPTLDELPRQWRREEPLALAVVSAPESIDDVARLTAGRTTRLAALEVKVPEAHPEHVARLAQQLGAVQTEVFVEIPRPGDQPSPTWLRTVDAIGAEGLMLKFRTGGVKPEMFPTERELAASIVAATDRGLAFKCTAGLHNALRHRDAGTGAEHHGFLNVLAATDAAVSHAGVEEVQRVLSLTDPAALLAETLTAGEVGLAEARRWFRSFGTCSITEPLEDLINLDLLDKTILESA